MGAIEISGIGMAMMEQGMSFDAGATIAAVLLSLLGVAAAGIVFSGILPSGRPGFAAGQRRTMPLSPASVLVR